MKKLILPLGILIAALTACDKRATMVTPNEEMVKEEMSLTSNSIAGTWEAVEYGRKPMNPGAMSLTAVPNSATTGQVTVTTQDAQYNRKTEMLNYTISEPNKQVAFTSISTEPNSLNGSWQVIEITPNTLHMEGTNGSIAKFTK